MVVEREIRAIIGPNGAGKSSLINLITGIYRPDTGTIAIGGRALLRRTDAAAGAHSASRAPSRTSPCSPASASSTT